MKLKQEVRQLRAVISFDNRGFDIFSPGRRIRVSLAQASVDPLLVVAYPLKRRNLAETAVQRIVHIGGLPVTTKVRRAIAPILDAQQGIERLILYAWAVFLLSLL